MLSSPSPPPPRWSPARVEVALQPLPPLEQVEALWRDLEARADASFFLSWTWIGSWLGTIPRRPQLLTARIRGEVVGLALVMPRLVRRHRVMPVWTLFLNQTGAADQDVITIEYNDILADRAVENEVRLACLRFLLANAKVGGRRVAELALYGLHEDRIGDLERLGRPLRTVASAGSARTDLDAIRRSGRSYLEQLKPSIARRLRRSLALYKERGPISVTAAADVDQALDFFYQAGALHQARWTVKGQPGAFAFPFYVDFHQRLIRAGLPEGQIELLRVSAGGEPIGFLYNFLYRSRVYYYFSGFRFEGDNRLKPGLTCHQLCLERHLDRGMSVYDFMGGEQRYKTELGEPGPRIVAMAVQRPNILLAAERPLRQLKQALSQPRRPMKASLDTNA